MAKSFTDLPDDVQREILVRLPLKTLFASKCVCRSLHDLTSLNPQFIKVHSSSAPQSLAIQFVKAFGYSRRVLMFEPENPQSEFIPIFLIPSWTLNRGDNRFALVNSCNGQLYFCVKHTAFKYSIMCNPVTNQILRIRSIRTVAPASQWLGFNSSTSRFKVLNIFSVSSDDESMGMNSYVVDVQSGLYTDVKYTPLGWDYGWDASSTFLDGVIHWFDCTCTVMDSIFLFNFEKLMFGEIALPLEVLSREGYKRCTSIGVLEGCLALSHNNSLRNRVDIWVRETRENKPSWRKILVVDTSTIEEGIRYRSPQFKPLQILRNGELLMLLNDTDLVYYDPQHTRFRFFGLVGAIRSEVVVFTPNFVSLEHNLMVNGKRPFISLKDPLRPRLKFKMHASSLFRDDSSMCSTSKDKGA